MLACGMLSVQRLADEQPGCAALRLTCELLGGKLDVVEPVCGSGVLN